MDEASVKIGVVTVTYNSGAVIDEFMESMLLQTCENFVLYIVDNASTDDTLERLEHYNDARIVIIPNSTNVGVAAGNNQGIKESLRADCSHVLLLNNDTVFEKDLFLFLLNGLKERKCDITVPKMMYFDNKNLIWFAGGGFSKWKAYSNYHIGMDEIDDCRYNKATAIEYAPTCCMLIQNSVFAKIGFMDEKYFVYYDDTDFCLRALKYGLKMYYLPNCSLYHKVSSLTGGIESTFAIRYMIRNKVYYIKKHKNFFTPILCTLFYFKIICDFVFTDRYLKNKDTFLLIQKSFLEGLLL